MTTIIAHRGDLYGDRKVLVETTPISFYDRAKIYRSSCNQFAMGLRDPGVNFDDPLPQEKLMRQVLERLVSNPPRVTTSAEDIFGKDDEPALREFARTDFIAITHAFSFGCIYGRIRELNYGDFGIGSDRQALLGFVAAGKSIEEAYDWVGSVLPMTGRVCDVVKHDSLSPFIIRGTVE